MTHVGFARIDLISPIGLKSLFIYFYVTSLVIDVFNDSSIKFDILAFNMAPKLFFCNIRVLKIIIIIIIIHD